MATSESRTPLTIWLGLVTWAFLLPFAWPSAADPLGATPHGDGSTTFRVWAPSVDGVGVRINDRPAVPLAQEPGHTDPADTTWAGTVPNVHAGDTYQYEINRGGAIGEFNDPSTAFPWNDSYHATVSIL